MSKRGNWGPMTARVGQISEQSDPVPTPPAGVKHCWVIDHHGRLPGLLLGWRRVTDQYEGRVVRLVRDGGGWSVVEEWLPAAMLEKA